jgi:translation initiation factor 2A
MTQTDSTGPSAPVKPAGAYRPPHARGTATPAAFRREDEGGAPHVNGVTNGTASKERHIPGLAPTEPDKEKKLRRKKKEKSDKPPQPSGVEKTETVPTPSSPAPAPNPAPAPVAEGSAVSPDDLKKQRALLKKLRASDELKLRQAGGEILEKTQLQKIEKEKDITAELAKLGFTEY